MKKIKGSHYAHVGTSYTPNRDAKFEALHAEAVAQQLRLEELIKKVKELLDYEA